MTLVVSTMLLLGHVYVWRRLASAVVELGACPAREARLAAWLVTAFLNLLPVVLLVGYKAGLGERLFLNGPGRHWLDYLLTFPFWWGLLVVLELLPYFLALDLAGGILRLAGIGAAAPGATGLSAVPWFRILAGLKVAVAAVLMVYVGVASYLDTNRVRLSETHATVSGLPPELRGLKLVLLGDVQVDRETGPAKIARMRARVAEARGDLILFAGDLVTDGPDFVAAGLDSLCGLEAPLGRAACMGDHDYWSAPAMIAEGLDRCGWTFLENQHHVIEAGIRPVTGVDRGAPPRDGAPTAGNRPVTGDRGPIHPRRILVTGVRYIYSDKPSPEELERLLAAAPPADLKILLVHQPALPVVEAAARHGYHLLLAGHTHGGQFVFHPFGFPLSPTQVENRFYSGHHRHGSLHVVVTNGVGLTLAPMRRGAPAEVSLVTLR
jgi:hypothetical protein